jgi:hypothetical protein
MFQARFARDPVLEAFWKALNVEIAPKHVQQAVVSIQGSVLLGKLVMDGAVGSAVEVIDIGLSDRWTGKAHE